MTNNNQTNRIPADTLRDLRRQRPWQIEYYFRLKQGWSESQARRLADDYVIDSETTIANQR